MTPLLPLLPLVGVIAGVGLAAGLFAVLFVVFTAFLLVRFSPYEAYRLSREPQRVGLIAFLDGAADADREANVHAAAARDAAELERAGIVNLNVFVRDLGGRRAVFACFETTRKGIDGLATVLSEHSAGVRDLERLLTPHPRAEPGAVWLRMEWMNLIATTTAFPHDKPEVEAMGLVAGLRPEREVDYRQLHQTNWPGVVDAMVRAHHRNWTTFLVELGDALYLFTYAEYIGADRAKDDAVMAADPSTQRWWRQTEPCLIDLHGEGSWSAMKPLGD